MKIVLLVCLLLAQINVRHAETIILIENIRPTGIGIDYGSSIINGSNFYHLSTNPQIVMLYDLETGNQIKQNGGTGDGPFEYRDPFDLIKFNDADDKFGIITPIGKLLIFDKNGDGLTEYRVEEFVNSGVIAEDYLFAYANRHLSQRTIVKINLSDIKDKETVAFSPEDDHWMQIEWSAGGITVKDDRLYFAYRTSPYLYAYDIKSSTKDSVRIKSDSFINEKASFTFDDVQNNPMLLADNLMSRSLIQDIHVVGDYVIIGVKHFHNSDLPKEYFLYDLDLNFVGYFEWDQDRQSEFGQRMIATYNDGLYFYTEVMNDVGELEKRLSRWEIEK